MPYRNTQPCTAISENKLKINLENILTSSSAYIGSARWNRSRYEFLF